MFNNVGWIIEGKIRKGHEAEFKAVVNEMVAATKKEGGTLNYQYYVTDDGNVLIYEHFKDSKSAHKHIDSWDNFADRWIAAAEPTRLVHLGDMPQDLRERHSGLQSTLYHPYAGFERSGGKAH
ncbi:putative quinol monooxygenase [Microbulbifer sp. EKSA008]|uniref:putative quinol monooxygenase n=1 Tax=unclassified Microbulbifer TaxID=2619833 RepID=UPI000D52C5AF|nr:antibiotic biosynthesis monooxygenase [Microbulbifer sp. A4B17]AWF81369.1 hypothetical protein BTJ40_11375 [Microbulbifer sp. A4B17]WNZ54187.1 antibiotic biosynthesis monooxygenase [Microbulbifer sp. MKSA007]